MSRSVALALIILRCAFGASIACHGFNKVKGGIDGTASWFSSIGMQHPKMQARLAATSEVTVGILLCVGFLTEFACAGLIALMLVAGIVGHRKNGYFIFRTPQGWEYCASIAIVGLTLSLTGPGSWSLDSVVGRTNSGAYGGTLALALGLLTGSLQLAFFWRPKR